MKALDNPSDELQAFSGSSPVPPEQLLLALLLMVVYGLPSEGLLKFRTSSFSRNREGLLNKKVLALLLEMLLSNDHVSMDGGLLQVGHLMPRNPFAPTPPPSGTCQRCPGGTAKADSGGRTQKKGAARSFHGMGCSNTAHPSSSHPDARDRRGKAHPA